MTRGIQFAAALAVAAALGAGATAFLSRDPVGAPLEAPRPEVAAESGAAAVSASARTDYDARIRGLAAALEQERAERVGLAAEVASLSGELARVRRGSVGQATARSHAAASGDGAAPKGPRPLDVDALVGAGFPEQTVREFKANVDQMELDRLYLRDIASREGWLNTSRFREETEALKFDMASTRDDYGEEFYDWMLYSTGHPNRVAIGDVMTGSAAEGVGLQPGDEVLSYDGQRIFSATELRDATIEGEVGHLTPIEVMRNGRLTRLMVPRGPLGIRVDAATIEPQRPS